MAEEEEERSSAYRSIQVEGTNIILPSYSDRVCVAAVGGGDEYRSTGLWAAGGRLRGGYGGQVIGQSLMAACHTVTDPDLLLLSAHCYFLSPVNFTDPVIYRVSRTKDGRSFSSRSIEVVQGGRIVSHVLASFKKPETNQYTVSHSTSGIPPGVYPPNDDRSDQRELFNKIKEYPFSPIDSYYYFRESEQVKLLAREPIPPRFEATYTHSLSSLSHLCIMMVIVLLYTSRMMLWLRCHGDFPDSCHPNVHRVAIAFLSDFSMPTPLSLKYPGFKGLVTSLDHSIWFHDTVDCDGTWFLHVTNCLQAGDGTSLNSSHMYSENGTLVASCQQQALYRPKSML